MVTFPQKVIDDAKADALAKYPNESCGIVSGDEYVACDNIASDPSKDFIIAPATVQPYVTGGTLQAVIHSHPVKQLLARSCPSKSDMIGQIGTSVPWGVIDIAPDVVNDPYWWGDFLLDQPLIGQQFHHGINDCYTVVRRWMWQNRKLKIADIPRDDAWWNMQEEDLYMQGFEKNGWVRISKEELQHGDTILGKIRAPKINHAGVFLSSKEDGIGVVLHHLPGRLSRREPAGPYVNRAELFLRYKPDAK
jgi:cell wall-associated NlpC family hydrolase